HESARLVARVIPRLGKFMRLVDVIWAKMFGGALDHDNCIRVFAEHNEAVRRFVPPERLLVFRVTEGWEPLCKFLGRTVPEGVPLPRLSEGGQTVKREAWQSFVRPWVRGMALTAGVFVVLAWWLL